MSDLPEHVVFGMPALSPTMEVGTLSSWKVAEGESFAAGDSIAEIETDKATIDFEAQDDGIIAKQLIDPGTEVAVGVPIMVIVEEEEDVAAFKNFEAEVVEAEVAAPVEEVAVAPPTPPPAPVEVAPVVAAAVPPPTPEPVIVAAVPETAPITAPTESTTAATPWGSLSKQKSPLSKTLSAKQQTYIDLYGSTGFTPL